MQYVRARQNYLARMTGAPTFEEQQARLREGMLRTGALRGRRNNGTNGTIGQGRRR